MDHRDISHTVDGACALRVAEAANSDVLSYLGFWVGYVEVAAEKNGYVDFSTFLFLFWAYASTFIYQHRK